MWVGRRGGPIEILMKKGQALQCRDEIVDVVHHVQNCPLSCLNLKVHLLASFDATRF